MAAPAATAGGIIPAQLGFLAIFNPSLGSTDETIDDQIVYYASITTQSARRKRRARARPTDDISQEERHQRLRQIGLAQGMVNFGRAFSNGAPVDAIDTDKSRVIAHELEPGWWILASIDLNKVPLPPRLPTKQGDKPEERYEYNSREMKPAELLLRDLLRAHGIFLLHHDSSLSSLFARCRRSSFAALLSRYWDLFLSTWNVMLHGNPIRDVFGGINVAASGELGVGVGEEERGSGEREVLEGLVGRVEGLVDLVVSRFGEDDSSSSHDARRPAKSEPELWLGSGKEPGVEDGVIFLGTAALSRKSLGNVAHWMEDLYTWGEHAYGLIEGSTFTRRARVKQTTRMADHDDGKQTPKGDAPTSAAQSKDTNTDDARQPPAKTSNQVPHVDPLVGERDPASGGLDRMVSYLTLGYGSYWSLPGALTGGTSTSKQPAVPEIDRVKANHKHKRSGSHRNSTDGSPFNESSGHFLLGLQGEIEEEILSDRESSIGSPDPEAESNPRTVLRTLHVALNEAGGEDGPEQTALATDIGRPISPLVGNQHKGQELHHVNKTEKLRVVVYVNRPFIFTFLFRRQTDSLTVDALYRSLHYQLAPLRKPLLASTKYRPERPDTGPAASSIYDVVWDPSSHTVHSTIPNIPDFQSSEPSSQTWSRADAVSTHINLLNIHSATRSRITDLERTQKTNRGWWIVWTRILQHPRHAESPSPNNRRNLSVIHESSARTRTSLADTSSLDSRRSRSRSPGIGTSAGTGTLPSTDTTDVGTSTGTGAGAGSGSASSPAAGKEIYLIRRASDHAGYLLAADDGAGGGGEGVGRLAQGIGVDTRRYVEELLSLL